MITIELQRPAYAVALEEEQWRIKSAIAHDLIVVAAKTTAFELEDIHATLEDVIAGLKKEILNYKALKQQRRIN